MKKLLPLLSFFLVIGYGANGQTVLIEEYVDSIQPIPNSKPKGAKEDIVVMHLFYGGSINTGQKILRSGMSGGYLGFGIIYDQRVTNGVSVLFNSQMDYFENVYRPQDVGALPIELKYQRTRWTSVDLAVGPTFKISDGKRYYFFGINGYGGYLLDSRIAERYEAETGETITTDIIDFDLNTRWIYGFSGSIGRGRHSITVKYRLSPLRGTTVEGILGNHSRVEATSLSVTYHLGLGS